MFVKWPSIKLFHNIYKDFRKYGETIERYKIANNEAILYKAKVKLHGTNAAVTIKNDVVYAQSRNRVLTVDNDNMGFAAWVKQHESYFKKYWSREGYTVTVFGEWCGKGIAKKAAICDVDQKYFCIFAIKQDDKYIIEPSRISVRLYSMSDSWPEQCKILPWYKTQVQSVIDIVGENCVHQVLIDFTNKEQVQKRLDEINIAVDNVEKEDPFVKEEFGISGIGEGLVWYPINVANHEGQFTAFIFKAKGDKHKVTKTKKSAQISPEKLKNIEEFAYMFVSKNRLHQGVREITGGKFEFDKSQTGQFIGWVCKDVKKESKDELEASGLSWKEVNKAVATKARGWFISKCEQI